MTAETNKPQRLTSAARRNRAFTIAMTVSVVAGLFVGVFSGWTQTEDLPSALMPPLWLIAAVAVGAVVAIVWVSVVWWRAIDELARQAHYSAWLWGGSFGLFVGWTALAFASILPAPLVAWLNDPAMPGPAWRGGSLVAGAALAGYGLAWVVFWLRRR